MEGIKDALLRMIRSALTAQKMEYAYANVDLEKNPMHKIYGDLVDAIYYLVGEHVDDITESETFTVMTSPILSDERRANILTYVYLKNHPTQPSPNLMSSDGMKELYERNGGYMTPEGEWM